VDFSHPHVLRTQEAYDAAIAEIEALLDHGAAAGTAEYERLEFLSVMAEAYEKVHYPVERVRPQDVVEFRLEQKGMDRADLRDAMGAAAELQNSFRGSGRCPEGRSNGCGICSSSPQTCCFDRKFPDRRVWNERSAFDSTKGYAILVRAGVALGSFPRCPPAMRPYPL
jgi:antitoxin component HigA of HigAB toxin-antitoxin module